METICTCEYIRRAGVSVVGDGVQDSCGRGVLIGPHLWVVVVGRHRHSARVDGDLPGEVEAGALDSREQARRA